MGYQMKMCRSIFRALPNFWSTKLYFLSFMSQAFVRRFIFQVKDYLKKNLFLWFLPFFFLFFWINYITKLSTYWQKKCDPNWIKFFSCLQPLVSTQYLHYKMFNFQLFSRVVTIHWSYDKTIFIFCDSVYNFTAISIFQSSIYIRRKAL